jgi:endonuclease-3 related protein
MMNSYNVYRRLLNEYGPQGWWPLLQRSSRHGYTQEGYHPGVYSLELTPNERFEIITGAILTQNTNWANVRSSLTTLLENCPFGPEFIKVVSHAELAALIRSSGYYNQKAKKLKTTAEFFLQRGAANDTPPGRKELLAIWGIGPETADSILLYAFQHPVCVVDAYSMRIFNRLEHRSRLDHHTEGRLEGEWAYMGLQDKFQAELPVNAEVYNEFHALLVAHGTQYCTAKNQRCTKCPLKTECRFFARL